ncbi:MULTISPECIES: hypothetical protein [unclassified Thiocapsa]|uniref:hypothetical protein n=1 Tax=unclassified Thiocapsa TaxID=2641286 RepID=UPI0035ADB34A
MAALAGHRFNLPIEAIIADGLVLVECQPQIAERSVVERDAEQLPIGGTARFLVIAESEVDRVRRHQRVRLAERVGPVAGPAVKGGVRRQAGAHGIQLDVTVAQQQVGFGLNQGGFVAAVPEGAGPPIWCG